MDHWRAGALAAALVQLLEQVTLRLSRDAPPQALRYAQQWVQADPWQEAAHRQLMLLLATLGRKRAATEQFDRCAAILQEGVRCGGFGRDRKPTRRYPKW